MRSSMLKGLVVAVVLGAVLVPAAAAKKPHPPALKLALVPLQKAQLGSEGAGLTITRSGSGPLQNGKSKAGYQLTYGSPYLAGAGVDYVETSVNEYATPRAAKRDFGALKKDAVHSVEGFAGLLSHLNMTASGAALSVPGIHNTHWAVIATYTVANHSPLYLVAIELRDGKYVLESAAAAGSQAQAVSYAAAKARVLDKRLQLGLKGRLHAHPVAFPKSPKPGPPASGTDPATAILEMTDLSGSSIKTQGYDNAEAALSDYTVVFEPAGAFDTASQVVSLMPSADSAAFTAAFNGALEVGLFSSLYGGTVTPVDVSAAGDEAQAAIISASGPGTSNFAVITLDGGSVADVVTVSSASAINASDIQSLAQAAATHLDAVLP